MFKTETGHEKDKRLQKVTLFQNDLLTEKSPAKTRAPSSHELHALHHKKSAWVPKAHVAPEHVAPTSPKKDPRVQCPTARMGADHHTWPKKT